MSERKPLLGEESEEEEEYESEEEREEEEEDEEEESEVEDEEDEDEDEDQSEEETESRVDGGSEDLISGTASDESDENLNQDMLGDMKKLVELGAGPSFYNFMDEGGLEPNEYSDSDESVDQNLVQETFLLEQQKKVTQDYRRQEEHENSLQLMKDRYKTRKTIIKKRKKKKSNFIKKLGGKLFEKVSKRILSIDKYWTDLIYLVFTHMQIAGLMWAMPFTFPVTIYKLTQFAVFFNFDIISHREDDKIDNILGSLESDKNPSAYGLDNAPFYPFYLLPWLIIPPLILTIWRLLPFAKIIPFVRKFYYTLDRLLFNVIKIIYLPFLLHVYAHGFCGGQGNTAFQCKFFCADKFGWCLTRSVPSIILVVYFMVGFPLFYLLEANKMIVYRRSQKHRNYINNVEVEKALGISNNYVNYRFHMISSYSHFGCYWIVAKECLQKAVLVIIWASLDGRDYDGFYSWKSAIAICAFAFFVTILPLIIELYFRPYRNLSTLLISQILGWGHVVNFALAWFKALQVSSPFLLPTQLRILMLTLNLFILVAVFSIMVIFSCFRVKWPINERVTHELETQYSHYLKAIHDGYMLYHHSLTTSSAFVRCDLIIYHKEYLEKLHQEALLEQNPLYETIDDAILKLEEEYYANESLTIFPHKKLESSLPILRAHMDRRQTEMILIPPEKRIMLLKILALRAFIGKREVARKRPGEPDTESEISTVYEEEDTKSEDKLNEFLKNIMEGVEDLTSEAPTEELAQDAEDLEIDRLLEEAASEEESEDEGLDLLLEDSDEVESAGDPAESQDGEQSSSEEEVSSEEAPSSDEDDD